MGRHKRFSPKQFEEKWEEYKHYCDEKMVLMTEFSQKNSEFVTDYKKKYISYTIEGFCVYLRLARQNFYATYAESPKYHDIVTRIKEECEVDVREKFETECINPRLAGLWMSRYDNYKIKQEVELPDQKAIEVTIKSDSGSDEGDLFD